MIEIILKDYNEQYQKYQRYANEYSHEQMQRLNHLWTALSAMCKLIETTYDRSLT
jgi:hypothetical protein